MKSKRKKTFRKKTFRKKTFRKKTFRKKIYRKKKFRNLKGGATLDDIWSHITQEMKIIKTQQEFTKGKFLVEDWFKLLEEMAAETGHEHSAEELVELCYEKAIEVDKDSFNAGKIANSQKEAFHAPEGTIDVMAAWMIGYFDAQMGLERT